MAFRTDEVLHLGIPKTANGRQRSAEPSSGPRKYNPLDPGCMTDRRESKTKRKLSDAMLANRVRICVCFNGEFCKGDLVIPGGICPEKWSQFG